MIHTPTKTAPSMAWNHSRDIILKPALFEIAFFQRRPCAYQIGRDPGLTLFPPAHYQLRLAVCNFPTPVEDPVTYLAGSHPREACFGRRQPDLSVYGVALLTWLSVRLSDWLKDLFSRLTLYPDRKT